MEQQQILIPVDLKTFAELIREQVRQELQARQPPPITNEMPIGVKEAAKFLNLSQRTVRAKIASEEIPYYRRYSKLYFFVSELAEYIKTGKMSSHRKDGEQRVKTFEMERLRAK